MAAMKWDTIQANIGTPSESMRNAMSGISQAGTIFGDLRKQILDQEQRDVENQFREKQFEEQTRQFGLSHGLDIDKLKESIRATDIQAETTRRGQDKSLEGTKYSADSSAATAAARLTFDKSVDQRKADAEARALETSKYADSILQGLAVKTDETKRQNIQKLADFDEQISSPEIQIALNNPITGESVKKDLQKQREILVQGIKSPVSEGEILTNFVQAMQAGGKGTYVVPILKEQAEKSGDHARALQLKKIDSLNASLKGNTLTQSEYLKHKSTALNELSKIGTNEGNRARVLTTLMESNGYDKSHIISVLSAISKDTSILERNLPSSINETDALKEINELIKGIQNPKKKTDGLGDLKPNKSEEPQSEFVKEAQKTKEVIDKRAKELYDKALEANPNLAKLPEDSTFKKSAMRKAIEQARKELFPPY